MQSLAKYFASEMVGRVADKAVQIFGGAGYVADYGIERLYRDAWTLENLYGSPGLQRVALAKSLAA